ncbi:MAG: hypothetical protein KF816_11450 [Melioribacteraceae bacterium]|jgi:hypothetical protein|nr:hypothetical protein [Melioribacteraceae bacterium]
MFLTFLLSLPFVLLQLGVTPPDSDLMLKILIPTGSVSGTLSVIWYYLIRHLVKQNQEQFQFALKQNQEQFDKALSQIEKQHKENIDESRRTNDKLFEVIKKDSEYKEILAGILKGIESAITTHNKLDHRGGY